MTNQRTMSLGEQLNEDELVEVAIMMQLVARGVRMKRDHGGTWGEHPKFPVSDWQTDDTRLGYWEWVCEQIEMHEGIKPKEMSQYELKLFQVKEGEDDATE